MTLETKRGFAVALAAAAIIASCSWIYFTQIKVTRHNIGLHEYIGKVLAEQTANLIGKRGKVVTVAIETKEWPELKTQLEAFKSTLKKLGDYELRDYEMDTKDQPKYGVGSGLSGRRYVRTFQKNEQADVIVSFIGAPNLSKEEIQELTDKPKFIAESRSSDHLSELFENKLISVAVVSRYQFPSPGTDNPKTPQEWFIKRYQVVTPETARTLPKPE
jgi:hypothetical protein